VPSPPTRSCGILVLNCNGIPNLEEDPSKEAKMDALMAAVLGSEAPATAARLVTPDNPCMFAILLETHTSEVEGRLSSVPHLRDYKVFASTLQRQHEGRRGHGVAILVHPSVADSVRLVQLGAGLQGGALQSVWLRASGIVFGLGGDVMVGGCYIPPSTQRNKRVSPLLPSTPKSMRP
jgi:hypothetical protein